MQLGIIFLLETACNNMLLPGQIENIVILMDFKGYGVTDFPIVPLKTIIGCINDNYKGRLYRFYGVSIPSAFSLIWAVIKPFLSDTTVKKVSFIKQAIPD